MTKTPEYKNAAAKIICALDVPSVDDARALVAQLHGEIQFFKIGYELLFTGGLDLAQELIAKGNQIFFDTKLYDIARTVGAGVHQLSQFEAELLTVHADYKTIVAAKQNAGSTKILAVCVLTSHDEDDLRAQAIDRSMSETLCHRAKMAVDAGADGLICAPQDLVMLRELVPNDTLLVTPGVRPKDSQSDDHARAATPRQAIDQGANYLVIGRPLTQARDPSAAAKAIINAIISDHSACVQL